MARPEEPKVIFSMIGVSKKIERKLTLRDISLSFYYGAKIGVLGFNGSGKSSLMCILPSATPRLRGACTSSLATRSAYWSRSLTLPPAGR